MAASIDYSAIAARFVETGRAVLAVAKHHVEGRGIGAPTTAQTWNHRNAMARTIRMMEQRSPQASWRPCVPLTDHEGY